MIFREFCRKHSSIALQRNSPQNFCDVVYLQAHRFTSFITTFFITIAFSEMFDNFSAVNRHRAYDVAQQLLLEISAINFVSN